MGRDIVSAVQFGEPLSHCCVVIRRQGHATTLLRRIEAALEREGCAWALLVTTAEGRSLYEREGWRYYPEKWVRGVVERTTTRSRTPYRVYPFEPGQAEDGWGQISSVDATYHTRRPLTAVRTLDFWRTRASQRISAWMATEDFAIYVASAGSAGGCCCGYALVEFYPTAFQIRDLAVLPSEPNAFEDLLVAISQEAQARGTPPATRLFLPREAWIEATLRRLLGDSLHWGEDDGQLMACPMSRNFTMHNLDVLFQAPDAVFSSLDLF